MIVYVVFKTEDGFVDVAVTAFTNKEKATSYVDNKNNTTAFGWYHQEIEVEA